MDNFLENEAARLAREEQERRANPQRLATHAPGDVAGMRQVAEQSFAKKDKKTR